MRMLSRIAASVLALTLSLLPGESWAPTQLNPAGGGATAPVTVTSSTTGYGKQFWVGNNGAPVAGIFTDDSTVLAFHPTTATSMSQYKSTNGGRTYTFVQTTSGFGAGSFGQLVQLYGPSSSGRLFFVMLASSGGLTYASNIGGTVSTGWSVGPAGGGAQDGITGAIGPNGTNIYMRESGGVGQTCRSTNDGTTWVCSTFLGAGSNGLWNTMSSPASGVWMFANNGSVWRSTDDGQSFQRVLTPANGINGMACISATICLVAGGGVSTPTIFRSTDAGASWGQTASLTGSWGTNSSGSIPFINFGGGVVVALQTQTITQAPAGFRSTDFGVTWQQLPFYNAQPGGTNGRGFSGAAVRGGRAVTWQWTNESINTQIYSTALGSGATTIADDQGNQLKAGSGCAGASTNLTTFTNISVTANAQLLTGIPNTRTLICHYSVYATGGANNVALVAGTGATCGTNTVGLFGGATAATGQGLAANGQYVVGDGKGVMRRTTVDGDNVCILVSAATQVSGLLVTTTEIVQ